MSANGKILVDSTLGETRAIVVENDKIKFFDYETVNRKQIKGNVYLGKITRVEASLQAAFVDYGGEKHGFLPFSEINPNYYNLPKEQTNDSSDDSSDISNRIHAIKASSGAKLDEKLENIDKNAGEIQEDEQESLNSISNNEDEVETVSDDETFNVMHSTQPATEYQIQEVIRRGQIVLVQVMKEERGNKGAFLTTYLSFAGRYCVLMPNSQKEQVGGISRRIEDLADRRRLRNILEAFDIPENCNVIVRTAGSKKPARDIKRDYQYLVALWNEIREHTLKSKAPAFIHAEGDLLRRTMRDIYDDSVQEVLIQGDEAYNIVSKYTSMIMPDNKYKVKKYNDSIPIFTKFGVEEKLSSLYSPIVHLESGGYIVINPTEALIAIDVNSGKATNERNIEETAYNTNIEAAYEIARQLMLRDLSGLIVIDFIDMLEVQNRIEVERVLKSALAKDKAKIQMARISHFGLLEMSRQRLRPSFYEANTIYCEHCGGKGYIRAYESTALMMLRTIEDELNQEDSLETLTVFASEEFVS